MNQSEKKEAAPEGSVQEQLDEICPVCNNKVSGNFCTNCGKKINQTCNNCWLKQGQPHSCGYEKCPDYKLIILEKSKP